MAASWQGCWGAGSVFQKHRWAGMGVRVRPAIVGPLPQVLMAQQPSPRGAGGGGASPEAQGLLTPRLGTSRLPVLPGKAQSSWVHGWGPLSVAGGLGLSPC